MFNCLIARFDATLCFLMSLLLYYHLELANLHTTHDGTESIGNLGAKIWAQLNSKAWGVKKYLVLKLSITLKELGIMLEIVLEGKLYYWDK